MCVIRKLVSPLASHPRSRVQRVPIPSSRGHISCAVLQRLHSKGSTDVTQQSHRPSGRGALRSGARCAAESDKSAAEYALQIIAGLPTQGEMVVKGGDEFAGLAVADRPEPVKSSDLDYLAELLAMQQSGPKDIGFFGTRNMGYMHQQLIEVLSYAMVLTARELASLFLKSDSLQGNHIFTSGATGTNAAVIRGALKAEKPDLLTVVLPQSLSKQPPESQELLLEVQNVISKPENDHLPLLEASRICNKDIVGRIQQVICFAFHDSNLLLETCREAKDTRRIVTLFYLD